MKSEKTMWFDGNIKPVRDGVYERLLNDALVGCGFLRYPFSKFENGAWYFIEATPNDASEATKKSVYQKIPWRGLAKDPKG